MYAGLRPKKHVQWIFYLMKPNRKYEPLAGNVAFNDPSMFFCTEAQDSPGLWVISYYRTIAAPYFTLIVSRF